jgi:hypothetical protein
MYPCLGQHFCVRSLRAHIHDNTKAVTRGQQTHSVLCRTTGHINERKQAPTTHLQVLAFAKDYLGSALKTMLGGEPHHIAEDSVFYNTLQQTLQKLSQPTQQANVFRGRVRSEVLRIINSGDEARPPLSYVNECLPARHSSIGPLCRTCRRSAKPCCGMLAKMHNCSP